MVASTTNRPSTVLLPAILTALALAIGAGLALVFALPFVGLYFLTMPVALILLWESRDVPAPIDRILAADAERARQRAQLAVLEAPPVAKAA